MMWSILSIVSGCIGKEMSKLGMFEVIYIVGKCGVMGRWGWNSHGQGTSIR